ncbi:DMT family transporter [Atopobium sp. oral taxon 810]|uniref:DMT family transporter n=1 Tax=Atopobium sp. oral taxon 810 TaxID=712158 RepID=UPI00039866CC|nr:DMT family transporter [Atopobium sp. oral taxon 810]ERI04667.1 putative membrane protein [Atopobium sp. oral taxon 810 str. F0209]
MKRTAAFPVWVYKLALLATTLIWGGSFVVLKGALDTIPATWLLTIRFAAAGLLCIPIFWKRLRSNLDSSHLVAGALIGISGGAAYLVQNIGLTYTTPAKNAFFTATYCVMVPFLYWAIKHRRPQAHNVLAALLCIVGVCLVTLGSSTKGLAGAFTMGLGDALTLGCALLFAINIVLISILAPAHDLPTLIVIQLLVFAAVCAVAGIVAKDALPTITTFTPDLLGKLAFLILLGTVLAIVMQNLGQKYVDPSQAALIMSFESVFGVIFSVLIYHETVTTLMLVGFASIFVSILVSELIGGHKERKEKRSCAQTSTAPTLSEY